jgi:tyrosyl-tRNA synthetase
LGALAGSEINSAKVILANEVTTLCHGADAAAAAEATARDVFERGGTGDELPTFTVTPADLANGLSVSSLFVTSGLAKSGKDAKRLIVEGGARMNDTAVMEGQMVTAADLAQPIKLTAGRKRHALIVLG